ncbi:hypothetical protein M3Y95_00844200 [Aphelenchoides besseyi]|nr:hypothetical protein M3Y95_00844200 [Aphelenchoides besseyi]
MNTLNVFFPDYFPFVSNECARFPSLHVTERCLLPGVLVEIIHAISTETNLTIIPRTALDFGYELSELDDIGTFLYGLIENGTIDLVASSLQWTEKRAERFEFTEPIYEAQTHVIKRRHEGKYDKIWGFFSTYDNKTWIALAIAWILQFVFCLIAYCCEANLTQQSPPNPAEVAWRILRIMLMQPDNVEFKTKSGKFSLFFFSLLQGTVLLGVYSSCILANIIHSNQSRSPETMAKLLQDLRNNEFYIAATNPQKWIFEKINTSTEFPYSELRTALIGNEIHVRPRIDEVIDLVVEDRGILFNQDDDRSFFESLKHCELTALYDSMPRVRAHLMFRKNHPHLSVVNSAIRTNRLLFQRILAKYSDRAMKKVRCGGTVGYEALKLTPYTGVLLVCFVIAFIGVVILGLEIMFGRQLNNTLVMSTNHSK